MVYSLVNLGGGRAGGERYISSIADSILGGGREGGGDGAYSCGSTLRSFGMLPDVLVCEVYATAGEMAGAPRLQASNFNSCDWRVAVTGRADSGRSGDADGWRLSTG